jgi:hypothetical protein
VLINSEPSYRLDEPTTENWKSHSDSNRDNQFRRLMPCPLDDGTKPGGPVETRTPIAGFVDQNLVPLDDKPKISDATSKE